MCGHGWVGGWTSQPGLLPPPLLPWLCWRLLQHAASQRSLYKLPRTCAPPTVCNEVWGFACGLWGRWAALTCCPTRPQDQHETRGLSLGNDRQCAPLTVCNGTQYEVSAPAFNRVGWLLP